MFDAISTPLIIILIGLNVVQLWMITNLIKEKNQVTSGPSESLLRAMYDKSYIVRTGIPSVGEPDDISVAFRLRDIEVDLNSEPTYDTYKAAAIAQLYNDD